MNAIALLVNPLLILFNILLLLGACRGQSPTPTPVPTSQGPSIISQPIIHPARLDVLVPGSTFTITWTPDTHFKNVTIQLWDKTSWGYSRDLLGPCFPWARNPFCGTIAMHAANTGTYDWLIPDPQNGTTGFGFPRDERLFWIKMYVEDYVNTEIGNADPVLSYSQNFAFAGPGESGTTVTDVMTSTSSDGSDPNTIFVTVHENKTAGLGGTGAFATATRTAMVTGSDSNSTESSAVEGGASRLGRSMMGALLIILGLI